MSEIREYWTKSKGVFLGLLDPYENLKQNKTGHSMQKKN